MDLGGTECRTCKCFLPMGSGKPRVSTVHGVECIDCYQERHKIQREALADMAAEARRLDLK